MSSATPARKSQNVLEAETRVITLPEHDDGLRWLAWSPDQRLIAAIARKAGTFVLNTQSGDIIWAISYSAPDAVIFDPTGKFLVSPAMLRRAGGRSIPKGFIASRLSLMDPENISSLTDDGPDNRYRLQDDSSRALFATISDDDILVLDTASWRSVARLGPIHIVGSMGSRIWPKLVTLDVDRATFTVALSDGQAQTWNFRTGQKIADFKPFKLYAELMAQSAGTGTLVLAGSGLTQVDYEYSKDFKPGTQIRQRFDPNLGMYTYYAPGMTVLIRKDDPSNLIQAWDPQTGHHLVSYMCDDGLVTGLAINASGHLVAATRLVGHGKMGMFIWDAAGGRLLEKVYFDVSSDDPYRVGGALSFSPDDRKLAVAVNNQIHVYAILR